MLGACLRFSPLWRYFITLHLQENVRARLATDGQPAADGQPFVDWLLQLGDGRLPTAEDSTVQLPPELVMVTEPRAVLNWTFGDLTQRHPGWAWMASRAILGPKNATVDRLNGLAIDLFPGEAVELASADEVTDAEGGLEVPQEYLNTLTVAGLLPHLLRLKPGMPAVLLRNISPADGLCNGLRLIVQEVLCPRLVEATIASGSHEGERVFIPRMALSPTVGTFPFDWMRRQFPLCPAFALTINKAQGQTLSRVAVYLEEPVFGHGQLYVAASRVGRAADLRFALAAGSRGATRNIVHAEVFGQ